MRLLKLPRVLQHFPSWPKIAATISLVLVLPLLPETAITGMSKRMQRGAQVLPGRTGCRPPRLPRLEAP